MLRGHTSKTLPHRIARSQHVGVVVKREHPDHFDPVRSLLQLAEGSSSRACSWPYGRKWRTRKPPSSARRIVRTQSPPPRSCRQTQGRARPRLKKLPTFGRQPPGQNAVRRSSNGLTTSCSPICARSSRGTSAMNDDQTRRISCDLRRDDAHILRAGAGGSGGCQRCPLILDL